MAGSEARGGRDAGPLDSTGLPHLDEVLGGGLPRGALALIIGPPGSGKTTLAAQIAFAAGRQGQQVLLLTALSESTTKLAAHLRTLAFFDEELLGTQVTILSLTQYLPQGLPAAAEMIVRDVRQQKVRLVVLDGFSGLRGAGDDVQATRLFLYDLGTALSLLGCTTIVTTEGIPRDATHFPEMTTFDVVIGVHYGLRGVRESRALEALKVRGAALLPGLHGLVLAAEGVQVYPRLEARVARDARQARHDPHPVPDVSPQGVGRATFQLPALDALLGGGLTVQTATLIQGSPGVGKTLLGLQWALAGVLLGQSTVFLSFHETAQQLQQTATTFGFGPALARARASGGGFALLHAPSADCDADVIAAEVLAMVDQLGARRVVIDSLADVERAVAETSGAARASGFFAALLAALRMREVTTLVIRETGAADTGAEKVSLRAENVLWLQQVTYQGRPHRVLSAPMMRFSAHDPTLREYRIHAPGGVQVLEPEESVPGLVAGISRQEGLAEHPALQS